MFDALYQGLPWQIQKMCCLKTGVYKLETTQGALILKKIKKPLPKMEYIWGMMEYLPAHGFTDLPVLLKPNGKNIPLIWQGDIYFASSFCEGTKADFTKKTELLAAVSCLGAFHAAACGLSLEGARSSYFLKRAELQSMHRDLLVWGKACMGADGEFVRIYQELLPVYLQRVQHSFALLEQADYEAQAKKAAAEHTVVHGDVAARNFILHNGRACLIDFDYSRYDFPQTDVARLLERSLGLWGYDTAVFCECMAAYTENYGLSRQEMRMLLALLHVPRRFWRLGKRYFVDGILAKSTFKLKKLQQVLPAETHFLREAGNLCAKG